MDDRDYDVVIAKVPKVNESGRDVSKDEFGPGGKRDEEGRISALAYDFQPLEEEDDDDSLEEAASKALATETDTDELSESSDELAEVIIKLAGVIILTGGAYLIGRYRDEISVAMHKAGRWAKTKLLKKEVSEEDIYYDNLKLLNKTKEKIEKTNYEINTSFKKGKKIYDKTINDGIKKLSILIDDYNNGSIFSLKLLLNLIFTLKVCINNFNKATDGQDITCVENWKTTITCLNMDSFLTDIKDILKNDSNVRNEIIVSFGGNSDIDENKLAETIKLFIVGDEAA